MSEEPEPAKDVDVGENWVDWDFMAEAPAPIRSGRIKVCLVQKPPRDRA